MRVRLKVLKGKSAGRKIAIPGPRFVIGRGDDCDLRPKSDAISRRHCEIEIVEDQVVVRDLGSRNGTHVDEVLIEGDTTVRSGSVLRIGRLEFEVVVKGPAVKPSPTGTDSASLDETDITDWLDEVDVNAAKADPETRQFKLDDTERVTLSEAQKKAAEAEAQDADASEDADDAQNSAESDSDSKAEKAPEKEKEEAKDRKKPKPGKLPPRAAASTSTSQEAAADMLKKFFNRP